MTKKKMTTIYDAFTGEVTHRELTAEEIDAIFREDAPAENLPPEMQINETLNADNEPLPSPE